MGRHKIGGINIRVTFPYTNLLMKGEKFAVKWQRRAAFCGEGNSADRCGCRSSFQHHNRPDSAAVGISLNMINVGMCLENVFRPLDSMTSDLQNYTQDKCADFQFQTSFIIFCHILTVLPACFLFFFILIYIICDS